MRKGRGGKDFFSFAGRVRAYRNDIPRLANELKKETAKESLREIVDDTPVDSGEAKGNWQASLGGPASGFLSGPYDRSGAGSISRGLSVIDGAQPGQSVHLTNNAPHINLLNSGWSSQASAGYVQAALGRARLTAVRKMYKTFRMP